MNVKSSPFLCIESAVGLTRNHIADKDLQKKKPNGYFGSQKKMIIAVAIHN